MLGERGASSTGTPASRTTSLPSDDGVRPPIGLVARLIQIFYAAVLIYWLVFAALTAGPEFPYDCRAWSVFLLVAGLPMSIWLLQRRARIARPIGIVTAVLGAGLFAAGFAGVIDVAIPVVTAGAADAAGMSLVTANATDVITMPHAWCGVLTMTVIAFMMAALYLGCSSRMRKALVCSLKRTDAERVIDFDVVRAEDENGIESVPKRWRTWSWWRNVALFFGAFTILGHWAEMGFCQLIRLGVFQGTYTPGDYILWKEWLYPYVPEGIAVVLIIVPLYPLKEWLVKKMHRWWPAALVLSFIATTLVCTSVDFITGILYNADFSLWDYSNMPFNFMGQICLQNSLIYGGAATFVVWLIYPPLARLVHRPSKGVMDLVFAGFGGFYAFIWLLYMVTV